MGLRFSQLGSPCETPRSGPPQYVTGWRAGTAQHNYAHWTKVNLPEGKQDMANLERIPGVLPFEVYAQAPLRLVSWCSFELPLTAKRLLRQLAVMCEDPETTTTDLIARIAKQQAQVHTEQEATQYLANLATVSIATRDKLPNYTTMFQEFMRLTPDSRAPAKADLWKVCVGCNPVPCSDVVVVVVGGYCRCRCPPCCELGLLSLSLSLSLSSSSSWLLLPLLLLLL